MGKEDFYVEAYKRRKIRRFFSEDIEFEQHMGLYRVPRDTEDPVDHVRKFLQGWDGPYDFRLAKVRELD
tara:strand:+ start:671 stop:877 length:207 start_codon:yes stop_codon:yes gene_type:complete